ncbi:3'-5' exonuclease [Bombilactobacillus folatiphilus]|uniref:3'-5' exonuclease n=1 Tax=Bombilactobacillus folatiphilus TaxID=2923362 RepID=A0ABY4P7R1_9LACO|nr:3'-5' exonuclease [Bombilactobacillus folatiphilus]UQS81652.1 3'-5' exonuclease [Bombilactobacillus folatiphilus]
MNFTAMDFETANYQADSACSLALALVENDQIVDTFYTLINPQAPFNSKNISIHHIRPQDVATAPTFDQIWPHIQSLFDTRHLITAHNASFDTRVLRSTLAKYQIAAPTYNVIDTLQTSRKFYPQLPNHKLNTVSYALQVNLINHHHALDDTIACAQILIKTELQFGNEPLQSFIKLKN